MPVDEEPAATDENLSVAPDVQDIVIAAEMVGSMVHLAVPPKPKRGGWNDDHGGFTEALDPTEGTGRDNYDG